jgi:cytochrome P450
MATQAPTVPSHVPSTLVFDADLYNDPDLKTDMHAKMARLHEKYPDVFYSTASGGYWVVTRQSLISEVMTHTQQFSSRQGMIPPVEPAFPLLPLTLDPPANTPYRTALMKYMGPRGINAMADEIRRLAVGLLDRISDQDVFEFVRPVGAGLPVTVFMNLMGLPLERFDEFRQLVLDFFSVLPEDKRREVHQRIDTEMSQLIADRQRQRRDDLVSKLLDEKIDGKPMAIDDLLSMSNLLFMAGMDTVANAAAFMFYYLAQRPDLQQQIAANPTVVPDFVEESLRMYGVVNTPRQVREDVELGGVRMKRGDMVFVLLALVGRDERVVPDPGRFDLARKTHPHMAFGVGPHICAGQYLARVELRVLVEEWFKRYRAFSLAPGYQAEFRSWQVMALSRLMLKIDQRVDRVG